MFTDNPNVSRRAVTKTAAWGVPAVAVVSAAPAFAASGHEQTIVRPLTYRVFVALGKPPVMPPEENPPYALPPGTIDQGVWDVVATTTIPVSVPPNSSLAAPPLAVQVATSVTAADTLRQFAITHVSGTSNPRYTISGSVVGPGPREANLVVPRTATPATGGIVTDAAGSAQPETSTTAGTITQQVGKFSAVLLTEGGGSAFLPSMGLSGALEPAGQAIDFGSITVG